MVAPKLKMRLGDLLVHEHIITNEQLMTALNSQKSTGRKLGDTLIELGFIGERQLLEFLAQQLDVPFLDISQLRVSPEIAKLLPEVHARRLRSIVLKADHDSVLVGMSDPADLGALDQLEDMLAPRRIRLAVVMESQLFEAFDSLYRRTADIENFASQLGEEYQERSDFELASTNLTEEGGDATVGKLLTTVFEDAVQMRASDIHIEPDETQLRIRLRVDGLLQENVLNEAKIASAMVLRLKLMAGLDISEKRLPQDGRFNLTIKGHNIDVRMSTMPVQYGESCVMRLLDQTAGLLTLDQTGMPEHIVKRVRAQLDSPHGMMLVTGPTGSGKTTTLYGALSELNQSSKKIITAEDPVEYRLPRIQQVNINSKIDLTFASVLRTALRQDPDIIMVGEMRDQETAEMGLRAALTGHMVLSTLHTNDAITSALRLLDMGAAGFLVGSSLRAVIAQRLVRRICSKCSADSIPDEQQQLYLKNLTKLDTLPSFKKGVGCQSCSYTGYKGRIGVFEFLEIDEPMMNALKRNDAEAFGIAAKRSKHFRPLALAAFDYAGEGVTSVDEVLRLTEAAELS